MPHPRPATRALGIILGLALAAPTARAQSPAYPPDRDPAYPPDRDPAYPPDRDPLQTDGQPLADPDVPPELVLPPVAAMLQAQRLARAGRHLEAALLYESLWASSSDLRLGYHAARERALAGHHAVALRHFQRVLELGTTLSEPTRAHLASKLASERAQTRTVRVRLVESVPGGLQDLPPAAFAGARLIVEAAHEPGVAVLTVELGPGELLPLDLGAWVVRVEVPGYLPLAVQQTLDLAVADPTWQLELMRRPVAVDLRFSPPNALRDATLRLTATDRSPPPVIERPLTGPRTTVMLTTGPWQLEVGNLRYQATLPLTITPRQGPIDVVLRKRSRPADPRFTRDKKLVLGVLGGFGASYLVGIGLILGGASRESRAEKRNDALLTAEGLDPKKDVQPDPAALARIDAAYPTADYHRDMKLASTLNMAGVHVSIGGIGAAMAVLPVAMGARKRVAYIELGVGAAFLAGGSAWLATFLKHRAEVLAPDARRITKSEFDHLNITQLGVSMVNGLGIGLVTFSLIALIVDTAKRRRADRAPRFTLDSGPGPGLVGGSLRARF